MTPPLHRPNSSALLSDTRSDSPFLSLEDSVDHFLEQLKSFPSKLTLSSPDDQAITPAAGGPSVGPSTLNRATRSSTQVQQLSPVRLNEDSPILIDGDSDSDSESLTPWAHLAVSSPEPAPRPIRATFISTAVKDPEDEPRAQPLTDPFSEPVNVLEEPDATEVFIIASPIENSPPRAEEELVEDRVFIQPDDVPYIYQTLQVDGEPVEDPDEDNDWQLAMAIAIQEKQMIMDEAVAQYWQDDPNPDFSLTFDELVDRGLIGQDVLERLTDYDPGIDVASAPRSRIASPSPRMLHLDIPTPDAPPTPSPARLVLPAVRTPGNTAQAMRFASPLAFGADSAVHHQSPSSPSPVIIRSPPDIPDLDSPQYIPSNHPVTYLAPPIVIPPQAGPSNPRTQNPVPDLDIPFGFDGFITALRSSSSKSTSDAQAARERRKGWAPPSRVFYDDNNHSGHFDQHAFDFIEHYEDDGFYPPPPLLTPAPPDLDLDLDLDSNKGKARADLTLSCGICWEECSVDYEALPTTAAPGIRLSCPSSHLYCSPCMAQHINTNVIASKDVEAAFRVRCPECPNDEEWSVGDDVAERVLDGEELDEWYMRKLLGSIKKFYCPNKSCSYPIEIMEEDEQEQITMAECPMCHVGMCFQCRCIWHGGLTCEEYKESSSLSSNADTQAIMALAHANRWRRCPNCKMVVEKNEGCNHMVCRCRTEFCYRCGARWVSGDCSERCRDFKADSIFQAAASAVGGSSTSTSTSAVNVGMQNRPGHLRTSFVFPFRGGAGERI